MESLKLPTSKPFRIIKAVLLSLLAAVSFSTKIAVSTFSEHANITLADNTLLWSVFVIALFFLYIRIFEHRLPLSDRILLGILSVAFGYGNVIGHSLHILDSWDFLLGNSYQLMLGTLCALGYAGIFYAAATALFYRLDSSSKAETGCRYTGFLRLLDEHPRIVCSVVIGIVLLFWLLIYFPGYTNNDLNYQLRQFYGIEALTNSHPVLSTMIIGSCMSLGKLLGSDNIGLFIYMLLQAAVFVYAFGYVCSLAKKVGTGIAFRLSVLLFYAVLPVWGAYSVQAMKDGLFTGVFTLFVAQEANAYVTAKYGNKLTVFTLIRLAVVALFTCLLRSSVAYIVIPSLFFLAIAIRERKALCGLLIVTASTGAVAFAIIYVLLPALGVIKCNKAESLSIPFQQVARIVKEHGSDITDEERANIDRVLSYDELACVYMPVLSDPVKDTYKQREQETEEESVSDFMQTWKKLLRFYPSTALQATLANTYGYFSFTPSIQTSNGHTGMCFFLSDDKNNGSITTDTYSITYPAALKPIRKLVLTASYLLDAIPGFNLLYACAFYFWMTLLLSVYIMKRGGIGLFGLVSPCLLLQLGCLGSAVNDCFRYEAPVAAALPVLLIFSFFVSFGSVRKEHGERV